jgi:hypothetical protein
MKSTSLRVIFVSEFAPYIKFCHWPDEVSILNTHEDRVLFYYANNQSFLGRMPLWYALLTAAGAFDTPSFL